MFSGIVERMGEVVEIRTDRQNKDFTLRADFCKELKIDQSIAHNGVCLTVVDIRDDTYTVTAMKETLDRSNLGLLAVGDLVNLERSMKPDALLDGHIVQGHVDQTALCTAREDADGSWYYTFEYKPQGEGLCTVEKGSVAVNGVTPSEATVQDGTYEIQRPFVLVTKEGAELSPAAQAFFDWATSADAADLIRQGGAVPVAE